MSAGRGGPITRTVLGGLLRRRVQTAVVGLVLLTSSAACVLATGLVVDSNAPFDTAFAAQHGAHAVVTVDRAKAGPAALARAAGLAEVTSSAGPFPEVTIIPRLPGPPGGAGQITGPPMTLVGRASPDGKLDDLTLRDGRWPRRPGEIVLSSSYQFGVAPGMHINVGGLSGTPRLTVVGTATSIDQSASGWVVPGQISALRPRGTPPTAQLLFRFTNAGSAAAIRADVAAVSAVLPHGAVTAAQSYLAVRLQESSAVAPVAPFVVAFALIGLVTSVLIVINVVSGAVVAGYRRIGILKSIGFTPGQVTGVYAGQVLVPAAGGCLAGVVLGNVLAVPVLSQTASVYGVGTLLIPAWVDLAVPATLCGLTGLAALLPALRAGRLSAVQAIATGRAPRAHRGLAAHGLLSKLPLPRPVTLGLAAPFARPARIAVSTTAILLGATAVTCAVGLSSALTKVASGLTHTTAEPVQVYLPGAGGGPQEPAGSGSGGPQGVRLPSQARQERTVEAALRRQPGTLRFAAVTTLQVSVAGMTQQVPLTAFRGTSDWTGYDMINGRWYRQPGEVDVPTSFLTVTGTTVGDTVAITAGHNRIQVRIVGEVFDTTNHGLAMFTGWQTLRRLSPDVTPGNYEVGLRPGTPVGAYARALSSTLGPDYAVNVNATSPFLLTLIGLVGSLVLLLAVMAGLGVLNTVVMHTRERVHDLGIFKAIGMTPRQTISMIVSLVAGPGLLAGLIAVPAGIAVLHQVLPAMASAAGTRVPASYLDVYRPAELLLLALAGLVIAVAGAVLPAGWAARTRTAAAIRAE